MQNREQEYRVLIVSFVSATAKFCEYYMIIVKFHTMRFQTPRFYSCISFFKYTILSMIQMPIHFENNAQTITGHSENILIRIMRLFLVLEKLIKNFSNETIFCTSEHCDEMAYFSK